MSKVLIIEDDFYIRRIYSLKFEGKSFKVDGVENGRKAKEKLADVVYDLILLDIMLPDMEGVKLLQEIRSEDSINKDSMVLVVTNNDDPGLKKKVMDTGANKFFVKASSTPKDVLKVAEEFLSKK